MITDAAPLPNSPPKQVSRFEADLLRIARFFFKQVPSEEAIPLIRARRDRPNCLSLNAVHLVRDTLSKGCVLYLVRSGGWKKDRFLRDGEPKAGRLWERTRVDDMALDFSRHSLELLIRLTADQPNEAKPAWGVPSSELTSADCLLLFLAYRALRDEKDIAVWLRSSASISENPLCRLAYPADFASTNGNGPLAFDCWFGGKGSPILEAMQPVLESRWLEIVRGKGQIVDWDKMREQGEAEQRVLEQFLDAAESAQRWDLTRFLLVVLAKVMATPDMSPAFWTGGLQGSGPSRLTDRLETQRSALVLIRHAERFRQWERRARTSGFMDEDYAMSKFWLGEWERYNGTVTTTRAAQIVEMLEPLRTV